CATHQSTSSVADTTLFRSLRNLVLHAKRKAGQGNARAGSVERVGTASQPLHHACGKTHWAGWAHSPIGRVRIVPEADCLQRPRGDRKSTRLNSTHVKTTNA